MYLCVASCSRHRTATCCRMATCCTCEMCDIHMVSNPHLWPERHTAALLHSTITKSGFDWFPCCACLVPYRTTDVGRGMSPIMGPI
jgi:hypothetical protein